MCRFAFLPAECLGQFAGKAISMQGQNAMPTTRKKAG
jgi:hypothetical protein